MPNDDKRFYVGWDEDESYAEFDTLAEAKKFGVKVAPHPGDFYIHDNLTGFDYYTEDEGRTWVKF